MESGEAWLGPYDSGEAAILVENNDNIKFVVPEEGTNYFVDGIWIQMCIRDRLSTLCYSILAVKPETAGAAYRPLKRY